MYTPLTITHLQQFIPVKSTGSIVHRLDTRSFKVETVPNRTSNLSRIVALKTTPNESLRGSQLDLNINYLHLYSLESIVMLASLLVADNFPSTWPKIFHFETSRGSKYISDVGDAPFVAPNCQSILRKSRSNKFLKVDEINTKEFLDALKQKMFDRSMDNGRQDPQLVGDFTDT